MGYRGVTPRSLSSLLLLIPALLLAGVPALRAADRDHVRQAYDMLSGFTWARTLEIDNPRRSAGLPARVLATVFAFDDILWLYIPRLGTQSLSHVRGRIEADRERLLPLLREISEGFTGYVFGHEPERAAPAAVVRSFPKLRNGCFVESLHRLAILLDHGVAPSDAGLLTVYARVGPRVVGHTGLLYRHNGETFFWDPIHPTESVRVRREASDRSGLARDLFSVPGDRLERVHYLPIPGSVRSERATL